jgi:hypothetical protein
MPDRTAKEEDARLGDALLHIAKAAEDLRRLRRAT